MLTNTFQVNYRVRYSQDIYVKYCRTCLSTYIVDVMKDSSNGIMKLESNEHEINRNRCITFGYIESTLTKRPVPILYLPWLDNDGYCIACNLELISSSDYQKHCTQCHIIYIGCRYCLTTNIIFGFANQSQCNRCKRIFDITSISGNCDLDDFLYDPNFNNDLQLDKAISETSRDPMNVYDFIRKNYEKIQPEPIMEWIPYSQISDMEKIAKGGFGIIYRATWLDGPLKKNHYDSKNYRHKNQTVIVKRFGNSQSISKSFLNEVCILIFSP